MDKTTIICRCEEITAEDIEAALELGAESFDDVKRLTRCGMGPCQAKTCRSSVAQIIAEIKEKPLEEIPVPRLRMPLRPTPMGVLGANTTGISAVKSVLSEAEPGEGQGNPE